MLLTAVTASVRAWSICNAHFTFTAIDCIAIVFLPVPTRYQFLAYLPPQSLHRYVVTARTTAYRGPSSSLPSDTNLVARLQQPSFQHHPSWKPIEDVVPRSTNHKTWDYCMRHDDPRFTTPAPTNRSYVQSPGNAACLARSEAGRRTGPRMGHRGTCTHSDPRI